MANALKKSDDLELLLEALYKSLAQQKLVPNLKPHKDLVLKTVAEELKKAGFSAKNLLTPEKMKMLGYMIITANLSILINENTKLLQQLGIDQFKLDFAPLFKAEKRLDESSLKNEFKEFLSRLNTKKSGKENEQDLLVSEKELDAQAETLTHGLVKSFYEDELTMTLRNVNDGVDPRVAGGARYATGQLKGNAAGMIDAGPGTSPYATIDDGATLNFEKGGDYMGTEAGTAQHMQSNGICENILEAFLHSTPEYHSPTPFDSRKGLKPPGTI